MEIEKLIENMEEICALAELVQCETLVPSIEVRAEIERLASGVPTGGIGVGSICCPPSIAGAIIIHILKVRAERKAKEALLPVYEELLVKMQALNEQQTKAFLQQQDLLDEQVQKGKDNAAMIKKLSEQIAVQSEIIARFKRLQSA